MSQKLGGCQCTSCTSLATLVVGFFKTSPQSYSGESLTFNCGSESGKISRYESPIICYVTALTPIRLTHAIPPFHRSYLSAMSHTFPLTSKDQASYSHTK